MLKIVSVAKVAAYILMTAALVAFVACELDPGEQGEQGEQGKSGPQGARGARGEPSDPGGSATPGQDAIGPLFARGGETTYFILVDNKDDGTVGTPPESVDIAARFLGGEGTITFKAAVTTAGPFAVELDEDDGTLGISIDGDYTDSELATVLSVTATDAEGAEATKTVSVKMNGPPTRGNASASIDVTVGTQPITPDEARTVCPSPALNVCTSTVLVAADQTDVNQHFLDEFPTTVVLTAEDGGDNVQVSVAGHKITFTGLKSTWDATLNNDSGAQAPKEVKVRVEDARGLQAADADFITFAVTVDAEPRVKQQFGTLDAVAVQQAAHVVIRNLANFFEDTEGATLVITAKSDNDAIAEAAQSGGNLEITANSVGTVTVTVTATEPSLSLEQYVSQTVTIRVKN